MSTETVVALVIAIVSAVIAFFSAIYAGRQAKSAQDQVTQAENQVQEAIRANAIATESLNLLKQEREAASTVNFRFRPRPGQSSHMLDLVNDGPHDTYIVDVQLSGPGVNPVISGLRLSSLQQLGGGPSFVVSRDAVQIMDEQGAPGFGGRRVLAYDTPAQLVLRLKTNDVIYEVRTDVTLSAERGFSTLHTEVTP